MPTLSRILPLKLEILSQEKTSLGEVTPGCAGQTPSGTSWMARTQDTCRKWEVGPGSGGQDRDLEAVIFQVATLPLSMEPHVLTGHLFHSSLLPASPRSWLEMTAPLYIFLIH